MCHWFKHPGERRDKGFSAESRMPPLPKAVMSRTTRRLQPMPGLSLNPSPRPPR